MHACIHTSMNSCVHLYGHSYIYEFMHPSMHSFIHPCTHSGKLTLEEGRQSNCLCYATFTGKVVVYYDLNLTSVAIRCTNNMVEKDQEVMAMLKKLGVQGGGEGKV